MRYDDMVQAVAERNRTGDAEADRALTAALATLAEHLTPDEARQVRSQLPDELQETMATGGAERFDASELVRRFMARSGASRDRAGMEAEAVMAVVRSALSPGEWDDLVAQLPFDPSSDLGGVLPAEAGEAELAGSAGSQPGAGWRQEGDGWSADTSITKVDARFAPVGPEGQRYLAMGISMGLRLWLYEPAGDQPEVARDYETLGYCLSGRAELHSEGQVVTLEPGDSWVVPRLALHHYRIIEPFSAVEATHPPAVVGGRDL